MIILHSHVFYSTVYKYCMRIMNMGKQLKLYVEIKSDLTPKMNSRTCSTSFFFGLFDTSYHTLGESVHT